MNVKAQNQPIRLPGLKPGVCSGLILSGASYPGLKIGVWRRRTYQSVIPPRPPLAKGGWGDLIFEL
jgi:hypothetical protein